MPHKAPLTPEQPKALTPGSAKQKRFQQRLRGFRDEALDQRERVVRVESKLDVVLELLRGHIDLPAPEEKTG